jgi:hypothetical protein
LKRALVPGLTLLAACGVGIFVWSELGHVTAASVFLVITTAVLGWVIWVLVRAAVALVTEPAAVETARASGRRKKELEREKQALLKALKELEFDHEMGKVSDADYRDIGGQYRARATRVMRQLDLDADVIDYRDLVERDVKLRVKEKATMQETPAAKAAPAKESSPKEAPAKESSPKEARKDASSKPRCSKCSTENDADAEFCKRCGQALARAEAVKS